MYIKIYNNKIKLPKEYNYEERLKLVNELLEEYPEEFEYKEKMFDIKYGKKIDTNMYVMKRLEVLGTYLIKCDADYKDTIMSTYKEKARPKQEVPFSCARGQVLFELMQKELVPNRYGRKDY